MAKDKAKHKRVWWLAFDSEDGLAFDPSYLEIVCSDDYICGLDVFDVDDLDDGIKYFSKREYALQAKKKIERLLKSCKR